MTKPVFYGLARGGQWVTARSSRRRTRSVPHPITGESIWQEGLALGPADSAWLTTSLEVALERARLLPLLPRGWAVQVRRWMA
jgi:hypothetical protein